MAISAQHIVSFTRHSVSAPSQLCWTFLRGGLARLLPALFALWTRLPELLQIIKSKVRALENQSLLLEPGSDDLDVGVPSEDESLVSCEVLYSPKDDREMDIIFIHGLHGSTVKTWRQGDWNSKYSEVQRISLRNNSASMNQGICPYCHLIKYEKCKSFCDLPDESNVRPTVPLRSYSVPNDVCTSKNIRNKCDIRNQFQIQEEQVEEKYDSDDDILSFIIDKLDEDCEENNNIKMDSLSDKPCDTREDILQRDAIKNKLKCDIRNKIIDNVISQGDREDCQSPAIDNCDINLLTIDDYINSGVHGMRAVCDVCSSKNQTDNDCPKCMKIETMLIYDITHDENNMEKFISDYENIRCTLKRKYQDENVEFDNSKLFHGSNKFRRINNNEVISEKSSFDEYYDIENDLNDFLNFQNDIINFPDEELNKLTLQLSDNTDVEYHDLSAPVDSYQECNKDEENLNNEFMKHFCTCNSDNKSDGVKIKCDKSSNNESPSNCWPKDWLPLDYPNARIISLSYTTDQHLWRPLWIKPYSRTSLKDRSTKMVEKLGELGVGEKPIIWVGHSKGGLFIKEIFCSGYESFKEENTPSYIKNIYSNTKALVLYSVPHRGSPLANITFPPLLRVSSELEEIQHESDFVLKLHERFLSALENGKVDPAILSYCETRRTLMGAFYLTIVTTHSADPGVGHMYYGVSLDHRDICKPTSRKCFIYKELLSMIEHIQNYVHYR